MARILFLDCGDTMFDESTQIFANNEIVEDAAMLPDVLTTLTLLTQAGDRLCLVADGRVESFENLLSKHGLEPLFEQRVVSETVGAEKPSAKMFAEAVMKMQLTAADFARTVMIGNNLQRDIIGAKRFGLRTIWFDWSPRYPRVITDESLRPDGIITRFAQLPRVLDAMVK